MTLEDLVGTRGTVTCTIRGPEHAGEVCLPLGGGTQTFVAYASEEIARNAAVVVYDVRPGAVEVTKTT